MDILEIEKLLNANGINPGDIEDLETILKIVQGKVEQTIGFPLTPTSRKQMQNIQGNTILLDYYPVQEITTFRIDGKEMEEIITNEDISPYSYILNNDAGIIYLDKKYPCSYCIIEYLSGLSEEEIQTSIMPLIIDMIIYHLDEGFDKDATSIKEGDITVSYNSNLNKGALIEMKLNELHNKYNTLARII